VAGVRVRGVTIAARAATYLEEQVPIDSVEGAQAETHRLMLREAKQKLEVRWGKFTMR
jgi:hypothetical protein